MDGNKLAGIWYEVARIDNNSSPLYGSDTTVWELAYTNTNYFSIKLTVKRDNTTTVYMGFGLLSPAGDKLDITVNGNNEQIVNLGIFTISYTDYTDLTLLDKPKEFGNPGELLVLCRKPKILRKEITKIIALAVNAGFDGYDVVAGESVIIDPLPSKIRESRLSPQTKSNSNLIVETNSQETPIFTSFSRKTIPRHFYQ